MAGLHHHLNGQAFEQTPGDGEGQKSLGCCSPWRCEEVAKVAKTHDLATEQQQQQKLIRDIFSGGAFRLLM